MNILKPIKIGDLQLKNRMVMAPMGPEFGDFDERANAYYARRAEGGASMILMNVLATKDFDGEGPSSLITENSYDGFKELVDRCHEHDCKVCVQIMPGIGLGLKAEDREFPTSASSIATYFNPAVKYAELTKEEIKFIQEKISETVKLAKKAGADAIEIHGYGGYLTDQFMTERWNIRTDEYGGSFDNRMRFLMEIIQIIKRDLGDDFPLIVKFTPDHLMEGEGYRTIEEGIKIARLLEEKGVHALHVDAGCYDNWYVPMPPVYQQDAVPQLDLARKIKEVVSIPVITNGRLGNIDRTEAALESNMLDIAAIGRGLLADPDLPRKVRENRSDEIRHCISCNEGCIKSVSEGRIIDCAVNPQTGYEGVKDLRKTDKPKKVLVIGAGPAGCEAAISAKKAGHEVELWEKTSHVGGNFYNACQPSFKRDGNRVLNYYKTMLDKLDIKTQFNKTATKEDILAYGADKVINATGGNPIRPGVIKGINKAHVVTANDVLQKNIPVGENLVVIGAGLVGCETGLVLDKSGKKVTLIEMADKILPEPVWVQNLQMLNRLIDSSDMTINVSSKLLEIKDDSILYEKDGKEYTIPCDNVVLAMGFSPNNHIFEELKDEIDIVNIGDSIRARKVINAVTEAYDAVLDI